MKTLSFNWQWNRNKPLKTSAAQLLSLNQKEEASIAGGFNNQ
jgi:hypothetical protein